MNYPTWEIQDEIARIEGQLESTNSTGCGIDPVSREETLSDGAIASLSSRLNHLYNILYELNREDD